MKLSTDVAMASAREGRSRWSYSFTASASKQEESKNLVRNKLGSEFEKLTKPSMGGFMSYKKVRSKSILRRSCNTSRRIAPKRIQACPVAKRLVKKRIKVLRGLIPGGESMDEFALLEGTLDYILFLRSQVDVMQCLIDASELFK